MKLKSSLSLVCVLVGSLYSLVSSAAAVSGTIKIDGSSTVYPISAAIAEEFQGEKEFKDVRVTVGQHGTGGGFKKWCRGEIDINDASRPIKQEEIDLAKSNGIDKYVALKVAYDGISVVTSAKNTFLKSLTTEQLKALWRHNSAIKKWSDLNPSWPQEEIKLFGPGTDSGTYDYFVETVLGENAKGEKEKIRSDYVSSENDNMLVQGVKDNPNALAFFGYAYYVENKNSLKVLALTHKGKTVAPSDETIKDESYFLARPIYIYVSSKAAKKPQVQALVNYYLKKASSIAKQVGYSPLSAQDTQTETVKFDKFTKSTKVGR